MSSETACNKQEEGGDDVKSARLLRPGLQTRYNGWYRRLPRREPELIRKSQPKLELQAETRLHERGAASNCRSAHCGEYVLGGCTHRPSRHGSRQHLKSLGQPLGGAGAESGVGDWDEVVTR